MAAKSGDSVRFEWSVAISSHLNAHLMRNTAVRERHPIKSHPESMFLMGLDDKLILHLGMARVQQIVSFIEKANLQFTDAPRIFASIGHNTSQPDIRLCSSAIQ